ncbi:cache domain-containing protein [Jeotgalibaca sp. MA1X17-3]|uniref:cache domain-containing protein n=1 Tax=Jeotgalibaca sp. MA1X17-3 TaxID=2908211 RepID=UPI001F4852E2|nr:cache domain-containing protein [Jeotgalibaca sp. MA1X17-3]UJF15666.1 cache domain-containing protein [Jeotgalibaca sp. MA1X17-3]
MKKRHGSSFTNIFVTFSLVSIFLIISFISYIFLSTKDSVMENITNSKITSTNQIKNTFEREIQTIEKSFNAYSTTPSFLEMVKKPLQTRDFKQYREINSQLNYFSIFSLPGTNYSMTSLDGQWRIREGSLQQLTEEEVEQFKDYYVEERTENLYWVKGEDSIVSVSLLPIFSTHKSAIGMAEIPNQSIYSLLEVSSATTPFYIINRNDEIIYSANISNEVPHMNEEFISELKIQAEKKIQGS